MRKICFISLLLFVGMQSLTAQLQAFPGAEGYGRYVTGGRGGDVYIVTNLQDSVTKPPEGSLRWALNKQGPKTIVFAVSGTVELKRRLNISKGDVTIAGQTAPGDGICLSGETVSIESDNVVIRHIRFRCGNDVPGEEPKDAISCIRQKNIIVDHCSMSWSVDEAASFYDVENFTLQWCIISESLYDAGHPKGEHGYGGIWGGKGASFHHNLLASHTSRLPRFCGARYHPDTRETELVDFRNNVIFNWGFNSSYGGEMGQQNMINNYYKAGPATRKDALSRIVEPWDTVGRWHVSGNRVPGSRKISSDNWAGGVQGDYAGHEALRVDEPFPVAPVRTTSARRAYLAVLKNAGATLPGRDAVDERIISETRSGKCAYGDSYGPGTGIVDSQNSVGGWPVLKTYDVRTDTDRDGMPDGWELKRGLNPSDPSDRNVIAKSGYTMLEEYINSIR
ncbi:MAG: pectate lyase [Bacteroidales bacterium]|nr:pectate lyase [Bacteroidales bacterium]MDT8373376.1 pectate lyase [Bacteroidales bacterium]